MENGTARGMDRPFYQRHPDVLDLETDVFDARPGAVSVARSPFYPGGGGQMADRGRIAWSGGEANVTGLAYEDGVLWHVIEGDGVPAGPVRLSVDAAFRHLMSELHTVAHIANAVAFQAFEGALLTGANLSDNATLRIDLDLPDAANESVRALEGPINEAIRAALAVTCHDMAFDEAEAVPGLFRAKSVAPPKQADGTVRIVEIDGLDRQACGGTHLASTGEARMVRVLKVENKGRHNRRLRLGFVGDPAAFASAFHRETVTRLRDPKRLETPYGRS